MRRFSGPIQVLGLGTLCVAILTLVAGLWSLNRQEKLTDLQQDLREHLIRTSYKQALLVRTISFDPNLKKMRSWGMDHALNKFLMTKLQPLQVDRLVVVSKKCEVWADSAVNQMNPFDCATGGPQDLKKWERTKEGYQMVHSVHLAQGADVFVVGFLQLNDRWLNASNPDSLIPMDMGITFGGKGGLVQKVEVDETSFVYHVENWWTPLVFALTSETFFYIALILFLLSIALIVWELTVRARLKSGASEMIEAIRSRSFSTAGLPDGATWERHELATVVGTVAEMHDTAADRLCEVTKAYEDCQSRLETVLLELDKARKTQGSNIRRNILSQIVRQNGPPLLEQLHSQVDQIEGFQCHLRTEVLPEGQALYALAATWRAQIEQVGARKFVRSRSNTDAPDDSSQTLLEFEAKRIAELASSLAEQTINTSVFLNRVHLEQRAQAPVLRHWISLCDSSTSKVADLPNLRSFLGTARDIWQAGNRRALDVTVEDGLDESLPRGIADPLWVTGCYYLMEAATAASVDSEEDNLALSVSGQKMPHERAIIFRAPGFSLREQRPKVLKPIEQAEQLFRPLGMRCEIIGDQLGGVGISVRWLNS